MLDSVHLEQRGIPTVTFVTAPFERAARTHARIQGLPDLALVVIPHDYLFEPEETIAAKVGEVLPQVLDRIFAGIPGGSDE